MQAMEARAAAALAAHQLGLVGSPHPQSQLQRKRCSQPWSATSACTRSPCMMNLPLQLLQLPLVAVRVTAQAALLAVQIGPCQRPRTAALPFSGLTRTATSLKLPTERLQGRSAAVLLVMPQALRCSRSRSGLDRCRAGRASTAT